MPRGAALSCACLPQSMVISTHGPEVPRNKRTAAGSRRRELQMLSFVSRALRAQYQAANPGTAKSKRVMAWRAPKRTKRRAVGRWSRWKMW